MPPAPLKITAVLLNYPPMRFIGAERATHSLLRALLRRGHDVRVLCLNPPAVPDYEGVPLVHQPTGAPLPDDGAHAIISHPYNSPAVQGPLLTARAPRVIYAHSDRPEIRQAISAISPDLLITNSIATARGLGVSPGDGSTFLVRPPLFPSPAPTADVQRTVDALIDGVLGGSPPLPLVGVVNGSQLKGGHVIEHMLAHPPPDAPYTIVGAPGAYGSLDAYPALRSRMLSRQLTPAEMPAFYSRLAVFMQISFSESWGMCGQESVLAGTPVVSSNLPGTREALGSIGPRFVRWVDPMSRTAPDDVDAAVRGLLAAPPPTPGEDEQRRQALASVCRTSELDADAFIRALEARYG